ncbi:hypothetical protein HYPBUDRAFT_8618, partial [Hyphopichia burtonii NRRL Y-1933]
MIFSKSTAVTVALASASFLTNVNANNRFLNDDYADLAKDQPSNSYCLGQDIVQVGESVDLNGESNHHVLESSSGAGAKRSLASGGIAAGVGADVLGSTADIGAGLGGSILKRHLIDGAAAIGADADLLGAVSAGAGIGA